MEANKSKRKLAEAVTKNRSESDPYQPLLNRLDEWRSALSSDDSGDLSPRESEETDAAVLWLREKWGDDKPCPWCGNETYFVGPPQSLSVSEAGASTPLIPVICRNCGQTTFIDLRIIDQRPE